MSVNKSYKPNKPYSKLIMIVFFVCLIKPVVVCVKIGAYRHKKVEHSVTMSDMPCGH